MPSAAPLLLLLSLLPAAPLPGGLRLVLRDGQTLTGPLVRLDGEAVVIQTAWGGPLKLPRDSVLALTQLPGWQPVFDDDFSAGLKAWTVQGQPEVRTDPPTVQLTRPGQELSWAPPQPLEAGRVGVNFQQTKPARQGRWLLELHFEEAKKVQVLRVTLAGPGNGYTAEVAGLEGMTRPVERSPGWHRLTVQFGRRSLRVLVDDLALWYNLERGPIGPLRRVRLLCQETEADGGALAFTAFAVLRSVDEEAHPPGDPIQDEVWLASGDQLFGQLLAADARSVTLQGRYGKRTLPWTDVRGLYLRQPKMKVPARPGTGVKVWLHTGLTPDPDLLEGELQGLDSDRLKLRHALLGELNIERRWLKRVQPLGR